LGGTQQEIIARFFRFGAGTSGAVTFESGCRVTLHEGEYVGWCPDVPRPRAIASEPGSAFDDAEVEALGDFFVFRDWLRGDGDRAGGSAVLGGRLAQEAFFLIGEGKPKVRAKLQGAQGVASRERTGCDVLKDTALAQPKRGDGYQSDGERLLYFRGLKAIVCEQFSGERVELNAPGAKPDEQF
jgi:hypothetical protein